MTADELYELHRFVAENAHYCPHCPEGEREAVIRAQDLEDFLGEFRGD